MNTNIKYSIIIVLILLFANCTKDDTTRIYYKECEPLVGRYPLKARWSLDETSLIWDCSPYINTYLELDAYRTVIYHMESQSSDWWGTHHYVSEEKYSYAIVNDSTIIISGYDDILDSTVHIYPHLGTDSLKVMIIDYRRFRFQRYH